MKTIIICQARMGSTRFPGKVLKSLAGIPLMGWTVSAARKIQLADAVVVATSKLYADDKIEEYCRKNSIDCFRGSEDDVLDRCYQAAKFYKADVVVRLTCDCPFVDASVIEEAIRLQRMTKAHYVSNIDPPTYPDGLDVEVMTFEAIEAAWNESSRPTDRDCWPQFIVRNRSRFKAVNMRCPLPGLEKERWVCDTEADFKFCEEIARKLKGITVSYLDILRILDEEPELRRINPGIRNERFFDGLADEQLPPRTFERSERVFQRAKEVIPLGSQTFSKSHLMFPAGACPLFLSHGDGARVFDIDGNDYVDLVGAILPVILGYRDPDVDDAIRDQLDRGISFSLATEKEVELSELLCGLIPSAEMVRFGKSGTDVTTAAVRLARAYTGRKHIIMTGYHGWSDWSMAPTSRNLGIPDSVRALSHTCGFGKPQDMEQLCEIYKGQVAAIIVEPTQNADNYLDWLRRFCTDNKIILIFDEVITGFRWHLGGAQTLYNVTPDLSTFGKAMGNGMPISALVGKRDIMKLCAPPNNIFYSGTMFGEALSIAAALACIQKMHRLGVPEKLFNIGFDLRKKVYEMINAAGVGHRVKIEGRAFRDTLWFRDNDDKSFFIQNMAQNGVLTLGAHNLCMALTPAHLRRVEKAYKDTLEKMGSVDIKPLLKGRIQTVDPLRRAS